MTTEPEPTRSATPTTFKRTELQHFPSPIPGWGIVQSLAEIPDGAASGRRSHPGPDVRYIVRGNVAMEFDDRPTLTLRSGDPFMASSTTRATPGVSPRRCSPPTWWTRRNSSRPSTAMFGGFERGEGGVVRHPWHGSRFDLWSGEVLRGAAREPQRRFGSRLSEGRIEVRLP